MVDRTPQIASMRSRYARAGGGRSSQALHPDRALVPARQVLVDRLAARSVVGTGRQEVAELAVDRVADADLQLVHPVEHVELRHAQPGHAVDLDRALERRGVEPAAAPRPAGRRAELVAARTQPLAGPVLELGRERPGTDARVVRLGDAENVMQHLRAHASAGRRRAGDAVARCDVRVRAVVDVEQRPLRALEQQVLARAIGLVERTRDVGHHRRQPRRHRERFVAGAGEIHRRCVQVLRQHEVVVIEQLLELRAQAAGHEEILQPDRAPRDLVLVGRPDAAAGGADLSGAACRLARDIERGVVRQDQRTGFRDPDAPVELHAGARELVHLLEQRMRREHHAVADVAGHARMQNARRDQVQHRLPPGDHQRMPGVVSALEAHHALRMRREPVDDLPFALVTPLGADDDDVPGHGGRHNTRGRSPSCSPNRAMLRIGFKSLPLPTSRRGGRAAARSRARVASPRGRAAPG